MKLMAFIRREKLDPHPAMWAIFNSFYSVGLQHHSCGLAAVTSCFLIATKACTLTEPSVCTVLSTLSIKSLSPHHHTMTLLVPTVQMKKLRHGEIKLSAEVM